jgi:hypothetical protein
MPEPVNIDLTARVAAEERARPADLAVGEGSIDILVIDDQPDHEAGWFARHLPSHRRLPSWSDKLVGEVVRLLLEAYYEPTFSAHSHGFRPGRGCHTALTDVAISWTGTTWFIEGDIADCLVPWSCCSFADCPGSSLPAARWPAHQEAG